MKNPHNYKSLSPCACGKKVQISWDWFYGNSYTIQCECSDNYVMENSVMKVMDAWEKKKWRNEKAEISKEKLFFKKNRINC